MHDIIHAETEANLVSEAMARMRSLVLSKGPALMKTGHHISGISTEILSPEQRADMVEKLQADKSYTYDDAAAEYKVDRRTVFAIAKKAGVRRRRPVDVGKLREAVLLVRSTGASVCAASRTTGVPRATIQKALKK